MPCPRCGCRLVSPAATTPRGLVCSDCGHPMDAQLRLERPPWTHRELGAAIGVALISLSAMGLIWFSDAFSPGGSGPRPPAPEAARLRE